MKEKKSGAAAKEFSLNWQINAAPLFFFLYRRAVIPSQEGI
jgi:hypothetical protein